MTAYCDHGTVWSGNCPACERVAVNDAAAHHPVDHPAYYTQGAVEAIDAIEAALGHDGFVCFLRGQVIKYNWRLGRKDAALQDAKKAAWYQAKLIDVLSK